MKLAHVALLAQKWRALSQQVAVNRTMRLVTMGAVFSHRLVFPQEGSAFFGVAVVAAFIDGHGMQVGRTGSTVGIVAVTAD